MVQASAAQAKKPKREMLRRPQLFMQNPSFALGIKAANPTRVVAIGGDGDGLGIAQDTSKTLQTHLAMTTLFTTTASTA
jgi:pyruvate/2-oxoacid:ferredoxin oxidoreductase beta subunit